MEETGAFIGIGDRPTFAQKFPFPTEVPFPSRFWFFEGSVGPIYAPVNMQSTVEEKQQASQDKPLGASVLSMWSLRARHMHG